MYACRAHVCPCVKFTQGCAPLQAKLVGSGSPIDQSWTVYYCKIASYGVANGKLRCEVELRLILPKALPRANLTASIRHLLLDGQKRQCRKCTSVLEYNFLLLDKSTHRSSVFVFGTSSTSKLVHPLTAAIDIMCCILAFTALICSR